MALSQNRQSRHIRLSFPHGPTSRNESQVKLNLRSIGVSLICLGSRSLVTGFQHEQDPKERRLPTIGMTELQDHERWALYSQWLDCGDPTVRANAVICLIHQANFLLDQQIAALESQFITEGGYSEQLAAARLAERKKCRMDPSDRSNRTDQTNLSAHIPKCTKCGKLVALRTAKQGKYAGQNFWGCTGYPDCRETAPV